MNRRDVLLGITASVASIPSALACENNLQGVVDDIINDIDVATEAYKHRRLEYLRSVHYYNKRITAIFIIPRIADSLSYSHYIVKKIPENFTKEQGYIIAGMVYEQIMDKVFKEQIHPTENVWFPSLKSQ